MDLGKIPKLKAGIALDIDETLAWTIKLWVQEMKVKFKNPEKLSTNQIIEKYKLAQNVPYWNTEEAKVWMEDKRNSNDFQKIIPTVKDSKKYVEKISKIINISAYLTIRPEIVKQGTREWLDKNNFPKAPIICRPTKIPSKEGNLWKAKVLEKTYPKIKGIIDDNPEVLKYLNKDYKGVFFLYNNKISSKINVVSCKTWKDVYFEIKNRF